MIAAIHTVCLLGNTYTPSFFETLYVKYMYKIWSIMCIDDGSSSRTQQSQDISEILAGGTPIDESDLNIQELLGVGSTGKVYRY